MVAIAIPASCVSDHACNSLQEATYCLYEISRACALFNVNEIVIYSNGDNDSNDESVREPEPVGPKKIKLDADEEQPSKTPNQPNHSIDPNLILSANLLQYLITPPYLRKSLFGHVVNREQFKYARHFPAVPGIETPKHVLPGIAVSRERKKRLPGQKKLTKKDRKESGTTPYVNLGFDRSFKLKKDRTVPVNSRVFVNFKEGEVASDVPASATGYTVRAVTEFSQIFTHSPLKDGYSQTIYVPSQQFKSHSATHPLMQSVDIAASPDHEKLLLVFGKWSEVQAAVTADPNLEIEASELFDGVKLGTERARIEDSVMITLARS